MSGLLGIHDFNEVFQECRQFSAKWDTIGLNLGVSSTTIAIINKDNPNSYEQCMCQMLAKWLKRENEKCVPNWRSLCQSLEAEVGKFAADQIAEKYCVIDYNKQKDIDSSDTRPATISPNVLRSNHADLCRLLHGSESTLLSLTVQLYAKGIIDINIKIDVLKKGGFTGADILLTHVQMKIGQSPEHLDIIQKALENEQFLDDIVKKMKKESAKDILQSKSTPASIPFKEIDQQHLVKAMKDGFVQSHITKAVIQGAARAGKTSLKSLILSLPYKELSTPCIQAPDVAIGTLSVNRFGKSKLGKCWTYVNNEDMEEKILAELQIIALKEEPSSTISPKIPSSVVSPRLKEDDQEMSQNDIDVSSEFPVTPGQIEDVEKAVAIIEELYHRCSKGIKAQELSLHERWLYFTDCGGQIQFQKLLPAFLPCASALMLVINLAEDLSGPASTQMCLETGHINVSEHSPKVDEILKQLLVMVNSSSQQQKAIIENDRILSKYITPPDSLSIMAIATHRDEYDGKSETIEDKEEKLRNILKSVEGKICYQNKAQFKILHEVDGRKAKKGIFDDPVVEEIAFKLREQAYIVRVPLRWHCFQTLIQRLTLNGSGVLDLSFCKECGHKLGMSDDEVVSAIKFFHILNSMLYYPDSGADDIVFANIHCLIDIINELMVTICNARNLNIYPNSDIKLLAMEGIASIDFIKKMETCSNILKSFPHFVEKLLAIFQHLLIAVKVENNDDHFFIPALLPVCDTTDINPFPESTIPPMLFYFKKGLPMGLFCSIIVHLLSHKWLIIRNRNALNYSNFMIIQPLKRIGKFAIMETPYYIQLRSEFADDIEKVRCDIHESVEAAVKGNVNHEPGFFCPCPREPRNHIAVVAQNRPTLLRCCETNEIVEDTEEQPRLAWYGQVPEAATTPTVDTTSKTVIRYFGSSDNCCSVRHIVRNGMKSIVCRFGWDESLSSAQEMFQCKIMKCAKPSFHLCEVGKTKATLTCSGSNITCRANTFHHLSWFNSTDHTSILNKSPSSSDVLYFIKCHSARWDEFASELQVPYDTRESLRCNIALEDGHRLEQVVVKWIESQCSPVTWENIIHTLVSMDLTTTASKVQDYLKHQQVIDKSQTNPETGSTQLLPPHAFDLLQEKDLSEVMLATNEVLDWFTLGLHLKVSYADLKTIEANHCGNLKRCRQEMLMSWIRLGNARWDILVKVLQYDVHEVAVAEKIKKMLTEDTTNMESTSKPFDDTVLTGNTATPITHTHLPHDILKFHIPHLCGVIANPDKLVNDPSLVTLIPDTVKDTLLNNLTLSRYQKASTLLDAIHHNLEECSDPQILKSFCYILKVQDDSALDGIANTMLKQLGTDQDCDVMESDNKKLLQIQEKSSSTSDEETMEVYYEKTLEREPLEEKKSKPVDEDKPKSDISDKMLILEEEIESLQTIVISKNEQVEELQSKLEKKDEIVKELESIQEQVKPLQTEIFDKTSQVEELQTLLEIKTKELEPLQEQVKSLQRRVDDKTCQIEEVEEKQGIMEKTILEKESELLKLSVEMREKSEEITHLKTREMSLIDKSDTLEKELGFLKDETQAYKEVSIATRRESQDSQTLLMIERKASLAKTLQITYLEERLKLTSTLSSDEETLEREPLEEKKSKPVDEDKPKSDISDKMLILEEEEIESLQTIVISKNEQVEELQSALEMKDEIVKEQKRWLVHLCVLLIAIVVGLFSDHSKSSIYPDGMQVVGEKRFIVTGDDSPFTLDWIQFGLHIEVPEGSLPAGHRTELHVKAIIAGDFILPPDCYLVSGIYQISSSEQFKKDITLHLPHAAIIKSEDEASYFRFYTADCSSGPPYEFKEMEGGSFLPFHNSASIDVHHFSCFATGAIIPPNQQYLSQVLYKSLSNSATIWDMVFTITKNDPSFVKHVQQRYNDYHLGDNFLVQFQENATYLQIIPESHSIILWYVYKAVSSQIERTVIESYHPKNNFYIPHCTYNIIWQSDLSPRSVNLKFKLVGVDIEFGDNEFSVLLPPEDIESIENKGADNVIKSTIDEGLIPPDEDLLDHLHDVTQVQSFCVHLKLTLEDCDQIYKDNPENLENQKIAILRKWKQIKEQRTWKEIILLFALLRNCAKAKELAIEYSVYFEEDLKDDKKVLKRCKDINNHE